MALKTCGLMFVAGTAVVAGVALARVLEAIAQISGVSVKSLLSKS